MRIPQTSIAVLYLLAAIGLISLVDTICKFYTKELHAVMLVWGYFVGITVFVASYFIGRRQLTFLQTNQLFLQFV